MRSNSAMRWCVGCLLWVAFSVSAETRIGFGSCFNQAKSAPIWDAIASESLDGFIFLGDNVYASRGFSEAQLAQAYRDANQVIPWDQLGFVAATWDDHDFGQNDGGASFTGQAISQRLFWEFFAPHTKASPAGDRGVYHASIRQIGELQVQIIALDTRSFRGRLKPTLVRNTPGAERYVPNPDSSQSMLGAAQWEWLEATLSKPADLRIVMSSVQILADGHGWERWGNLPHERDRLLKLLTERKPSQLILLSGDRHIGGAYESEAFGERFLEFTSSGLNMAWTQATEYLPNQLGEPIREDHYAVLAINQDGFARVVWHNTRGDVITEFPIQ